MKQSHSSPAQDPTPSPARFATPAAIQVGVIGYGGTWNMGRTHLNEMKKAGMTPTAVCELDPARLALAPDDFPGIQTCQSVDELLSQSEVNLVAIITPHDTHAELALQCLAAGRHVVCEKPFAITTAECDAMIRTAKERNLLVSAYHNRHWDGWIMKAVEILRAGDISTVVRVEARLGNYGKPQATWRGSRSHSGGILYDWGVHFLEYALQLTGSSGITEVSGYAHNGFWENGSPWGADTIEDEAEAVVRFQDGRRIRLLISQVESLPRRGFLEVTGTTGSMVLDWDAVEVTTHDGPKRITIRHPNPENEWWRFYANIADHLTSGAPLVITGEWARLPVQIIDLASQSARAGFALRVPEP